MGAPFRRGVALAVALAGLLLALRWALEGAPPLDLPRGFLPLMVEITQLALRRLPWVGTVAMVLIAAGVATASALGVFLAARAAGNPAALRLSFALGLSSLALAWFFLVLPYSRDVAGMTTLTLWWFDSIAYVSWAIGCWQLVRVWRIFPQPISEPDWERHVAAFLQKTHETMRSGWRRWIYPARVVDPDPGEALGEKGGLAGWMAYGRNARQRARLHGLFESRALVGALVIAGVGCALVAAVMRAKALSLPPGQRIGGGLGMLGFLPMMYLWLTGFGAIALTHGYLEYHRRWGSDDDRRRISWIYAAVFVGGVLTLVAFLGAFALFILIVFFAMEAFPATALETLLFVPMVVAFPLFGMGLVVALALSVLYRGSFDPRHAARRITLWGLLGMVVAVVFVVLERAVALKLAAWLSLPDEWAPILAGGLAAATIAPVRGTAERAINSLVARYLPPDFIASGERRTCVVALCDLSGYTALSATDERSALLHAAVLQQKAAKVAASHGGRVVKSMGDAVLMEFADARAACDALHRLHAEMPAAVGQVGPAPLPLHSGAHVGEVVVGPDGDIYGQTVNLAARLQGQATDGQIVLSDALARQAALTPERLESLGERRLKNVPDPVECFLLV
jgi:class 3 adenylate cyclase